MLVLASLLALPAAAAGSDAVCRDRDALANLESRRVSQARAILEPCVARPQVPPESAFVFGRILLESGDTAGAVRWLETAVRLDTDKALYLRWLGHAYGAAALEAGAFAQLRLARRVRDAFERAVALDPDDLEARSDLLEYDLQAPHFLGGSLERARAQAAAIQSRSRLEGDRALARIAEHRHRLGEARKIYERALAQFPGSVRVRYGLVAILRRQKDFAPAFAILDALLASSPSERRARYELGQLSAESGLRLSDGAAELNRYLDSDPGLEEPSPAWAHYRLGQIYAKQGRDDMAQREFALAYRADPSIRRAPRD